MQIEFVLGELCNILTMTSSKMGHVLISRTCECYLGEKKMAIADRYYEVNDPETVGL